MMLGGGMSPEFGATLRSVRRSVRLSSVVLAQKIAYNPSSITVWERGNIPARSTLRRIASVLLSHGARQADIDRLYWLAGYLPKDTPLVAFSRMLAEVRGSKVGRPRGSRRVPPEKLREEALL